MLTVRASARAAVGVVAEGMDVDATLSVGIIAGNAPRDGGRRRLGVLLEGDGALDVGVTTENCDCSIHQHPSPQFPPFHRVNDDGGAVSRLPKLEGDLQVAGPVVHHSTPSWHAPSLRPPF